MSFFAIAGGSTLELMDQKVLSDTVTPSGVIYNIESLETCMRAVSVYSDDSSH